MSRHNRNDDDDDADAQASDAFVFTRTVVTPPPAEASPYVDANGALTSEGEYYVSRLYSANYVYADDELTDLACELSEADYEFPWGDVDAGSLRAALVKAGATPAPGKEGMFRARVQDGLGAENGPVYADPIDYLIDDFIPAGSVCLVVAPPYRLKTWLAMSAAVAVGNDRPWFGHAVRPLPHYLSERGEVRRTVWCEYEKPSEVSRRLHLLGDRGQVHRAAPTMPVSDPRFLDGLKKLRPRFVGIDSLSRANPGVDEKDSRFAEPLARIADFAREHETTFFIVAHSPKDEHGKGLTDVVRGSSAIAAAADVVLYLENSPKFTSSDPTERRARVRCLKMRQGGREPAPFLVRLTDAGGLERYEEMRPGRKPKDANGSLDELVYEAARSNPGCTFAAIVNALKVRREKVNAAVGRLVGVGRIVDRGNERVAALFAVPES